MTSTEDVDVIRYGLQEETDMRVCLLNYRKNGTAFLNQFNLSPLRDTAGKLVRDGLLFLRLLSPVSSLETLGPLALSTYVPRGQ